MRESHLPATLSALVSSALLRTTIGLLAFVLLTTGCTKEQSSSETQPSSRSSDGKDGHSDRELVEAIRRGNGQHEGDPAFARLIGHVDRLQGKLTFDKEGRLVGIDLASGRVSASDADLTDLAAAKRLRKLLLSGAGITSRTIDNVLPLHDIEELTLQDTQILDEDLERLATLPKLKILNLRSARLSDKGLEALRRAPKLRQLHLTNNAFSDAAMSTISRMEDIELIDLRSCSEITDVGIAQLASLPRLRVLRLGSDQINDQTLQVLNRFKTLDALSLEDANITDEGLSKLQGPSIKELSLARCFMVTDDGMKTIATLPKLERLYLRDMGITDDGIISLSANDNLRANLRAVRLLDIMTGDRAAAALARLPRLASLHLRQALISAEGLGELARSPSLRELVVDDSGVDDQGVKMLAGLKDLRSLSLRDNPAVTDGSIDYLATMASLKRVDLRGTAVTPEGLSRLRSARPDIECLAPGLP